MTMEDDATADHPPASCLAREVLARVGDKWSLFVVALLADGTRRFSELRRGIEGISQRMLTVTLRALERDGLLVRTVHPTIPPRVEYTLTPLGRTLLDATHALIDWSQEHLDEVASARSAYDRRTAAAPNGASPEGDPGPVA